MLLVQSTPQPARRQRPASTSGMPERGLNTKISIGDANAEMGAGQTFTRVLASAPAAAAAALAVPATLAVVTHSLVLFASRGPTAVAAAHEPQHPSSRIYNVLVSHAIGTAAAFAVVAAPGLQTAPSVFAAGDVSLRRAVAAVLAIAVGTACEIQLRAAHAPAASTTLLVALGSFHPTLHDAVLIASGVVAVPCRVRRFAARAGDGRCVRTAGKDDPRSIHARLPQPPAIV
jgi:HPP family protein